MLQAQMKSLMEGAKADNIYISEKRVERIGNDAQALSKNLDTGRPAPRHLRHKRPTVGSVPGIFNRFLNYGNTFDKYARTMLKGHSETARWETAAQDAAEEAAQKHFGHAYRDKKMQKHFTETVSVAFKQGGATNKRTGKAVTSLTMRRSELYWLYAILGQADAPYLLTNKGWISRLPARKGLTRPSGSDAPVLLDVRAQEAIIAQAEADPDTAAFVRDIRGFLNSPDFKKTLQQEYFNLTGTWLDLRDNYFQMLRKIKGEVDVEIPESLRRAHKSTHNFYVENAAQFQPFTGAGTAPLLGGDVLHEFLRISKTAARLIGAGNRLRDTGMLLGNAQFRTAVERRTGTPFLDKVDTWLGAQSGSVRAPTGVMTRWVSKALGRIPRTILWGRLTTPPKQVVSVGNALIFVPENHFRAGLANYAKHPAQSETDVTALSPLIKARARRTSMEVMTLAGAEEGVLYAPDIPGPKKIRKFDLKAVSMIWEMYKSWGKAEGWSAERIVDEYEYCIEKSQPPMTPTFFSGLEMEARGRPFVRQTVFVFKKQLMQNFKLTVEAVSTAAAYPTQKNIKVAGKAMLTAGMRAASITTINWGFRALKAAAAGFLAYLFWPVREREDPTASLVKDVGRVLAAEVAPIGGGEIYDWLIYGGRGQLGAGIVAQQVTDLAKVYKPIMKAIENWELDTEEKRVEALGQLMKVGKAISWAVGAPRPLFEYAEALLPVAKGRKRWQETEAKKLREKKVAPIVETLAEDRAEIRKLYKANEITRAEMRARSKAALKKYREAIRKAEK